MKVGSCLQGLDLLVLSALVRADGNLMWYSSPASGMTSAIPVGNGRLGGLVYGGVGTERLHLNEDSAFSGPWRNRVNPDSIQGLSEVRSLMDSGDLNGADSRYIETLTGQPDQQRSFQTMGDLYITTGHSNDAAQGYNRSLDLKTSVATVTYSIDGIEFVRETVANYPTGAIGMRFSSSGSGNLNLRVSLTRAQGNDGVTASDNTVVMDAYATDDGSYRYNSGYTISADGGSLTVDGSSHVISNADSVAIYWDAETPYHNPNGDHAAVLTSKLASAASMGFDAFREEAVDDYSELYSRASLSLNNPNPSSGQAPTNERLSNLGGAGSYDQDPTFIELEYNFGRYLLISSSRPGSAPANLQGVWCQDYFPSWGSKYTININTEMNYWLAEDNNLDEVAQPLWDHLNRMQQRGSAVAQDMYGMSGWVCHHNTDIWGDCAPQDSLTPATAFPMGGVWVVNQAMDHWRFTKDPEHASYILPIAAGVMEFIYDFAVLEDGYWVIYPSNSPEISRGIPNQSGMTGLAKDTQMDRALMHDLFGSFIELSEAVGSTEGVAEAQDFLAQVGPPTVSPNTGRLMEWDDDYAESEAGHRHFSSMYGLHPGRQYSPLQGSREAYEGAVALLDYRMENGSGSTGWSRVWASLLRSRMFRGDTALADTHHLMTEFTSPNLFSDAHGAVQLDASFGVTHAINEMFLQSNNGLVHIGPAIPSSSAANTGSFSGWVARGSFIVDAEWSGGQVTGASITSRAGGELAVRVQDGRSFTVDGAAYSGPISTEAGQTVVIAF